MKKFSLDCTSYGFRNRAKEELKNFDNGQHESLFYAALNMRFAIEARLYEYLKNAYKQNGDPNKQVGEHAASKMLARLTEVEPDWSGPCRLSFGIEGQQEVSTMQFTPVSKKLAGFHGRIGQLLHWQFFENNPSWWADIELKDGFKNLRDFRVYLDEVLAELEYALSGSLLGHPKFTEMVQEIEKKAGE